MFTSSIKITVSVSEPAPGESPWLNSPHLPAEPPPSLVSSIPARNFVTGVLVASVVASSMRMPNRTMWLLSARNLRLVWTSLVSRPGSREAPTPG